MPQHLRLQELLLLPAPPSHLFFCSSFPTSLLTPAAPQVLELLLVCTSEICKDATLPCPFFPRSLCWCPGLCPWHYSPLSLGAFHHLVCLWEVTLPSCCIEGPFGHSFLRHLVMESISSLSLSGPGKVALPLLLGLCISKLTNGSFTCAGSALLRRGVLPPV